MSVVMLKAWYRASFLQLLALQGIELAQYAIQRLEYMIAREPYYVQTAYYQAVCAIATTMKQIKNADKLNICIGIYEIGVDKVKVLLRYGVLHAFVARDNDFYRSAKYEQLLLGRTRRTKKQVDMGLVVQPLPAGWRVRW